MYKNHRDKLPQIVAALLAMTAASCAVAHGDHSETGPNPLDHSPSHFYLPDGLISLHVETEDQRLEWKTAVRTCTPIQPSEPLDSPCVGALSKYFMNAPVWDYGSLFYADIHGFSRADPFPINPRPVLLPYGPADYGLQDIPRWRDIFDGKLEQRKKAFAQVAADSKCTENMHGAMQETTGNQCDAREMYKYAVYLDACTSAVERLKVLDKVTGRTEYRGMSTYDMTLQVIGEEIEDFVQQEMVKQSLEKGYLHASWVAHQCGSHRFALLPLKDEQEWRHESGFADVVEVSTDSASRWAVSQSHSVAMLIAARYGDDWAVQSYPITRLDEPGFLRDVYDKFPILYHRHLGAPHGTFGGSLSRVEQRRHQAQAYLLLKQSLGTKVAQLSYDAADLKEEIEYIQEGGKLTMFLPEKETQKESGNESIQESANEK